MTQPVYPLPDPISIYIHWPICLSKCPYCDFNSHVRSSYDAAQWTKGILSELSHYRGLLGQRQVVSVFFGGGTPSLIPPPYVAQLLDRIASLWPEEPSTSAWEVTLEANPTSTEAANFSSLIEAGVNRVSLGIQALNDSDLKRLGREHSAREAVAAWDTLCNLGAKSSTGTLRTSFDLIYARPEQSLSQWRQELSVALTLQQGHLSLYQLTIEPGTAFFTAHKAGRLVVPDADRGAAFYTATEELTQGVGMDAYEVSNYAKPGHACRHNMTYWRYADYIGLGPGAHGRFTVTSPRGPQKFSTVTHKSPERWYEAVSAKGVGLKDSQSLAPMDQGLEALMMGLRLREGVPIATPLGNQKLPDDAASSPLNHLWEQQGFKDAVQTMVAEGYLRLTPSRLTTTAMGRLCLNSVVAFLNAGIDLPPYAPLDLKTSA